MSLPESYFKLFDLPECYPLNQDALDSAYHLLLAHTHPDHFATAGDAQKRMALQWTARVNEAYRVLKDPVQRAIHLLHLRGIDISAEKNTAMDPAFLMQQMEWRSYLEAAAASKNTSALQQFHNELHETTQRSFDTLVRLFESERYHEAAEMTRQLMFIQRVKDETQAQLSD